MSFVYETLSSLRQVVNRWVIVTPWEQGLQIRLGRHIRLLEAGVHWRIPILDKVFIQSTRLRFADIPIQTISTQDGKPVTISGAVGYTVKDIKTLYTTLHHADDTLINMAMASVAQAVQTKQLENCSPEVIQKEISDQLKDAFKEYGLDGVRVSIIEFVHTKTFRVIQGQRYTDGDCLSTSKEIRENNNY